MFDQTEPRTRRRSAQRAGFLPSAASIAALALLAAVSLVGCATTGPSEERPERLTAPLLPQAGTIDGSGSNVQPADLWVQPVADESSGRGAPTGALRDELYRGLVGRLYTPIALGWGDARLTEAAGAGEGFPSDAMGAEGVLEVLVTTWDAAALERSGEVYAEVEVRLLDPLSSPPAQLWGRLLARELSVDSGRLRQATVGELEEIVARQLAREILDLLPQRDAARAGAGS